MKKLLLVATAFGIAAGPALAATINTQGKSSADAMLICKQIWPSDNDIVAGDVAADAGLRRFGRIADCMRTQGFEIASDREPLAAYKTDINAQRYLMANDPAAYQVEETPK